MNRCHPTGGDIEREGKRALLDHFPEGAFAEIECLSGERDGAGDRDLLIGNRDLQRSFC